jgi:cell division protein FtsZ
MLSGADIVFISAGLGGGTGTGAAPIIAQAAKEVGALTVSVVTSPFRFEGRKRAKLAKEGLEELKRESDSIIVVPNEKLLSIVEKNLGIKESFRMVDDILAQAVGGISKVILSHGENDINLDFADVKTVMSHRGLALMGAGYATGTNAAYDAAKAAIESPLLDNISIDGAMGVLVHFDVHPDYPIMEIGEAMGIIEESADEDAAVIFGTTTNSNMEIDEVKITIVATGFENPADAAEPTVKKQETLLSNSNNINNLKSRMVVGGYNDNEDILDVPTFLRKQMD